MLSASKIKTVDFSFKVSGEVLERREVKQLGDVIKRSLLLLCGKRWQKSKNRSRETSEVILQ